MKIISTRQELLELKASLGVRADWHEPDEQGVTATMHGTSFDNAGFWPRRKDWTYSFQQTVERHVIIKQNGVAIAAINLATLFAWATGFESGAEVKKTELDSDLWDEVVETTRITATRR